MAEKILPGENKVKRHGFSVRFVHWTMAISTFILIFSGFGQMPMYRRYGVANLPGLSWSADYSITIIVHYIAAMALLLAVAYHIIFHVMRKEYDILPRRGDIKESFLIIKAMLTKGEAPKSDKYLAEQRLAYAFIAFNLLVIIVTGAIKVLKNFTAIKFYGSTMVWVSDLHTLASMLLLFGIFAHLAAFIFKENWPLLPGIFTGKINLDYVKHRHSVWYDKLTSKTRKAPAVKKRSDLPA